VSGRFIAAVYSDGEMSITFERDWPWSSFFFLSHSKNRDCCRVLSFAWCKSFFYFFFSQEVPIRGHCSRWFIVCVSSYSQLVYIFFFSKMFHFLSVVSHRLTPVLERFNASSTLRTPTNRHIYSSFLYAVLFLFRSWCFVFFLFPCSVSLPRWDICNGQILREEDFSGFKNYL